MANTQVDMQKLFAYIDGHQELYVQRLADWVATPSISASAAHRDETIKMVSICSDMMSSRLGCHTEIVANPLGEQQFEDGQSKSFPPVLLASLGSDESKPTLLVYGHLDVQPAEKSDGWNTEPFVLTHVEGRMYGRGSTDDKGPVLCWINAIEAYQQTGMELPVNLKFVFEAMEESDSEGLSELLEGLKDTFLKDVDYGCISDNYWLGKNKPCLTYGLRGIAAFCLEVEGSSKDLHSGIYGGTVHEANIDLIKIMSSMVDTDGNILIPGISDNVKPVTDAEMEVYKPIDFDIEQYKQDAGVGALATKTKEAALMARWRFPSLTIHGIEGAYDGPGLKTVIPRKVIGKFSIRLVPDMTLDEVYAKVQAHVDNVHKSPNKITLTHDEGGEAWVADYNHHNFEAGREAMKLVFGEYPDLTREGGSIPVIITFQRVLGKNIMLLPVGSCDDGAHSQNEKLDRSNYFNGIKVMAAYFQFLAQFNQQQ